MGGWVKVEIKAISAQPLEVGVGLSWAELGNNAMMTLKMKRTPKIKILKEMATMQGMKPKKTLRVKTASKMTMTSKHNFQNSCSSILLRDCS